MPLLYSVYFNVQLYTHRLVLSQENPENMHCKG